jgi:hypothetical protein
MTDARGTEETAVEGKVIPFPSGRTSPPPLPPLRHTYPTPGGRTRFTGTMFGAALAARDRDAA